MQNKKSDKTENLIIEQIDQLIQAAAWTAMAARAAGNTPVSKAALKTMQGLQRVSVFKSVTT